MRTYIIRRVLLLIPTFLILTVLVFLSVRFLPGDAQLLARHAGADLSRDLVGVGAAAAHGGVRR